ncbi:MAG TPA: flagellar basal body-associated FliL family protein [Chromobacteriaceae bacterium]|nr:flagellar basal body-associated FliL family protein [Chromobacteriaceae bacterium]
MNIKTWVMAVSLGMAVAAAGATATWFVLKGPQHKATAEAPETVAQDKTVYKYLSVDKVIVMLRDPADSAQPHYLAVDLVIKVAAEKEAETKEQLPLLRSIALRSLSNYVLDKARSMTVDQTTAALNKAFDEDYVRSHSDKPFKTALISKLIIE